MPFFIIIVTFTIIIIRSIIIMTIIITFLLSIPGLSEAESPVQAGSAHPLITVTINPLEQDEVLIIIINIIIIIIITSNIIIMPILLSRSPSTLLSRMRC